MKAVGVECNGARRAALLQLAGRVPAAIVADLLGVHVSTATQWAQFSGRPWGDYPALRVSGAHGVDIGTAAPAPRGLSPTGS